MILPVTASSAKQGSTGHVALMWKTPLSRSGILPFMAPPVLQLVQILIFYVESAVRRSSLSLIHYYRLNIC